MEPIWEEVEGSSNIVAFAYQAEDPDANLGTLFVRFGSGVEYKYVDFPNQLAEDFFSSESKGKFFHANIRDDYSGERLDLEDEAEEPEDGQDLEDISEVEKKAQSSEEEAADLGWGNEGPVS